jgi:O-antigen/teichoic acid export membrane protein
MFVALKLGYGINSVGTILVLSEALILLIEWLFVYRIVSPMRWKIDWAFVRETAQKVRAFLVIEGISTFQGRMQLVFLSVIAGEVAVGLYGAAMQLIQPFQIIAQSVVIAAFPSLTRAGKTDPGRQRRLTEQVIELLFLVALPFIVGMLFIGRELLVFIYRDAEFAEAAPILNIIAFGMIAMALIRALSYLLVANGLERINLREVITTTSVGAVLSPILIGLFGLVGAAIAALSILIIACSQYVYAVYTQLFSLNLWHILRRPLMLTALMIFVFIILLTAQTEIIWKLLIAGGIYTLLVGIAGLYEFRARRLFSVTNPG